MELYHVDVFSSRPMTGNGLTVVFPDREPGIDDLLNITRELKQFETIFIWPKNNSGEYRARIFTVDEELPFAGHPVLGAAAVLHRLAAPENDKFKVTLEIQGRPCSVESVKNGDSFTARMDQGPPSFISLPGKEEYTEIAERLNIPHEYIDSSLPVETVSTGLPYLIVPLREGIETAEIKGPGFEDFLNKFGAKFVYVFHTSTLECRTWDNSGITEDVATGSAAGPLCAYLVNHGLKKTGKAITLSQGKFTGRPSVIRGMVKNNGHVFIEGEVTFFGEGEIFV